jgi:hypothetical protein
MFEVGQERFILLQHLSTVFIGSNDYNGNNELVNKERERENNRDFKKNNVLEDSR